ncbi:MAG: lysostaphin resistance A-like protein [Candidatus Poseidoniales archaeon]|tara:strand:- start:155 stop:925 length:771 start_codon:yes stop_codon:yes gene_type:complete
MEYCKRCSKPILSDLENQIYCSSECWRASKSELNDEEDEIIVETKSTLYVWSSIISMFVGLFLLLMVTATVVNSEEVFLPVFTISAGVLVLFVLQNILPKDEINRLLSFENNIDMWKLIGWVLLLDIFVILPLHAAFTLLVFPDAEQQEVINLFKESSGFSLIVLALTVSVFTPFAEEFLFRGFILTMLLKRYSPIVSIVISSFVFSIAHEPIAMALAFGGGCLYGWLRVKTGSIYPSMIAHAIWNGFITLVVIFA